jgi:pentatricopeptide repeat protein
MRGPLAFLCLIGVPDMVSAFSPRTVLSSGKPIEQLRTNGFQTQGMTHTPKRGLHVSLSNPQNDASFQSQNGKKIKQTIHYPKNRYKKKTFQNRRRKRTPAEIKDNLRRAKDCELRLSQAVDQLQKEIDLLTSSKDATSKKVLSESIAFPYVRDCNGAMAAFGDTGDLKRALRLFTCMRKAVALVSKYTSLSVNSASDDSYQSSSRLYLCPPSPTLVTYSTLMSRAVSLGKEKVALRLWRLMISSQSYFANLPDSNVENVDKNKVFQAPIVPDIRAVNILMNVFAKIGDQASAQLLMEQIYDGTVVPYDTTMERNGMITALKQEFGNEDGINSSTKSEFGSFDTALEGSGAELGLGLIKVVPKMKPNIVTYNTLIHACHRAGDLDAGK